MIVNVRVPAKNEKQQLNYYYKSVKILGLVDSCAIITQRLEFE